jgi:predicted nucleotidyltransferase component of viral defense system
MSSRLEQSVKSRLKNVANKTGKDFNFVSIQYLQERFLARLGKSRYRDHFVLKGALLLLAYKIPTVRPSKDIDFLGQQVSNDMGLVKTAIQTIAAIKLKDGVSFNHHEIDIEQIAEDADYGGLRIKISATVGGDRHRLQIDIGFGDAIVGGPVDMNYPAILNYPSPHIKMYSLESAIAEKLEAIVSLGSFGSRMKDYFDVWFITQNHELDKNRLKKAMKTTFSKRNTPLGDFKYIFNNEFKSDVDKHRQWKAFLNRTDIQLDHPFDHVIADIESYVERALNYPHF